MTVLVLGALGVAYAIYCVWWFDRRADRKAARQTQETPRPAVGGYVLNPKLSAAQLYCLEAADDGKTLDRAKWRIQAKTVNSLLKIGLLEGNSADEARITALGLEVSQAYNKAGG